ncbi:MAG: hypothetical protein KBB75_01915 [Candidatus Pacebacteria bacterium]|jgi:hypothetical protein|nr:hypothetical protein [Candidatus Paceibacterota bacterium]
MKKLFIIFSVFAIFCAVSCTNQADDSPVSTIAKCRILSTGSNVIVENLDFAGLDTGDVVYLEKEMRNRMAPWELSRGNIFTKDTIWTFKSANGPYEICVAKAVITKKIKNE